MYVVIMKYNESVMVLVAVETVTVVVVGVIISDSSIVVQYHSSSIHPG